MTRKEVHGLKPYQTIKAQIFGLNLMLLILFNVVMAVVMNNFDSATNTGNIYIEQYANYISNEHNRRRERDYTE